MEIRLLKNDFLTLKEEKRKINLEDFDFDKKKAEMNQKVHFAVSQIMENDDLNSVQEYFLFLSSFLSKEDFIFPPEFIIKIVSFIHLNQDPNLLQLVFDLIRMITSFNSIMQFFLIENSIFDILIPFFPNPEIIDIFSNLSCSQFNARKYLYDSNIINMILQHLKDQTFRDSLIHLSQNLVYNMDDFDYNEYTSQVIELYHAIIELFDPNDPISESIIFAFRDYIEAHQLFMDDFLTNNYLLLFKDRNIGKDLYFRHFIRICDTIITMKHQLGADYLVANDIPTFLISLFFQVDQEIRSCCFHFFCLILELKTKISILLFESDFFTISISEFFNQPKISYKRVIYRFWCEFILCVPSELLTELSSTIVYLIDNVSFIDSNDHEINLVLSRAINRIISSRDIPEYQNIINYMNENEEFYEWIQDTINSQNEEIGQLAMMNAEQMNEEENHSRNKYRIYI